MDEELKRLCLQVVGNPLADKSVDALVELLAAGEPELASHIREFLASGQTYPYGFVRNRDWLDRFGRQYIIVRVIPRAVAVRFACECAENALVHLEARYPSEHGPRRLIDCVKAWVAGKGTKKSIRIALLEVEALASKMDSEWNAAFRKAEFTSRPGFETDETQRLLLAIDLVAFAAQSAGLSKNPFAWLKSIDQAYVQHAEIESTGMGKRGWTKAIKWQLRRLADLISEN